jgi:predicted Holliday junction resolvase-like endonuclease
MKLSKNIILISIIILLIIIIFVLLAQPKRIETIIQSDENDLRIIEHFEKENEKLKSKNLLLENKIDSVSQEKNKLKYVYKEKYILIDRNSINTNDSIIRANLN